MSTLLKSTINKSLAVKVVATGEITEKLKYLPHGYHNTVKYPHRHYNDNIEQEVIIIVCIQQTSDWAQISLQ